MSKRGHGRSKRTAIAIPLVLGISLLAGICSIVYKQLHPNRPLKTATTTRGVRIPLIDAALRPKYPYSVIPGGVYSPAELVRAINTDPVVRAHYAGFNLQRARLVRLTEDHYAYVSYRVRNQVFWTHHPLRIPRGEVLLTDGAQFARSRCGNRLSERVLSESRTPEPLLAALSGPAINLENLHDFAFADPPENQIFPGSPSPLDPNLGPLQDFDPDPDALMRASTAQQTGASPGGPGIARYLVPGVLAAFAVATPLLVNDLNSSDSGNGSQPGNPALPPSGGGPNPPGNGGNPGLPPPTIPGAPVPEPAMLGVGLLAAAGLAAAKISLERRRRN